MWAVLLILIMHGKCGLWLTSSRTELRCANCSGVYLAPFGCFCK